MDGQQHSPVREGAVTGYMLATASGERFSPRLVISGVLGVLGMAGYLWRGHPRLRRSFKQAPLGSEVQPPPHPPERPGAA